VRKKKNDQDEDGDGDGDEDEDEDEDERDQDEDGGDQNGDMDARDKDGDQDDEKNESKNERKKRIELTRGETKHWTRKVEEGKRGRYEIDRNEEENEMGKEEKNETEEKTKETNKKPNPDLGDGERLVSKIVTSVLVWVSETIREKLHVQNLLLKHHKQRNSAIQSLLLLYPFISHHQPISATSILPLITQILLLLFQRATGKENIVSLFSVHSINQVGNQESIWVLMSEFFSNMPDELLY